MEYAALHTYHGEKKFFSEETGHTGVVVVLQ